MLRFTGGDEDVDLEVDEVDTVEKKDLVPVYRSVSAKTHRWGLHRVTYRKPTMKDGRVVRNPAWEANCKWKGHIAPGKARCVKTFNIGTQPDAEALTLLRARHWLNMCEHSFAMEVHKGYSAPLSDIPDEESVALGCVYVDPEDEEEKAGEEESSSSSSS